MIYRMADGARARPDDGEEGRPTIGASVAMLFEHRSIPVREAIDADEVARLN